MKTIFIRSLGLPLSAMMIALHPFAQKTGAKNVSAQEVSYNAKKETFSSTTDNSKPINLAKSSPDNQKALAHFNKMFFGASNVKWSSFKDKYLAEFTKNGTFNVVLFNKGGNIIYAINYVSEKQLPGEIKNLIEDTYEDYKITSADKVLQNNRTIWIVNLAGINYYVTARVENGEVEQVDKFKKAE